jgi:hypothetical protein
MTADWKDCISEDLRVGWKVLLKGSEKTDNKVKWRVEWKVEWLDLQKAVR